MPKSGDNCRQAGNTGEPGGEVGHSLTEVGVKVELHWKLESSETNEISKRQIITNKPEFVVVFKISINNLCESLHALNHSNTCFGIRNSFAKLPTIGSVHQRPQVLPRASKK